MIINTKEISTKIKFSGMILTILVFLTIVLTFMLKWTNQNQIILPVLGVYILFFVFFFLKKYNYIYYNSEGLKIIFRYSSLLPLSAGNFSIEIPRHDFVNAEIKSQLSGLRKVLIIYVKTNQGIAKFKPISLTTLSKKEIEQMMQDIELIKN